MNCSETLIATKKQHHALNLISEHIFYDRKSGSRNTPKNQQTSGLSLIQEFQLVVVLCEFYERPGQEMIRNAMFLSLFDGLKASRLNVLTKLVGTALATSVAPILTSAGTWIQQLGCVCSSFRFFFRKIWFVIGERCCRPNNSSCLELAKSLIEDFIVFSNKGPEQLKNLPAISARFVRSITYN